MYRWETTMGFVESGDIEVLKILSEDKICLEIGSLYGRSTVAMADVAKKVFSVDTHIADGSGIGQLDIGYTSLFTFLENINGYSNIGVCVGDSKSIIPMFPDDFFDFIFIDGEHGFDSVINDTSVSWPKLKIYGVLAFHDYNAWEGVTKAINDCFKKEEISTYVTSCIASVIKENGSRRF